MPKKIVKNAKIEGDKKKELERLIKSEIVSVQKQIADTMKTIKNLDDNKTHLFPFYNCLLHNLESYKETLEEIKY